MLCVWGVMHLEGHVCWEWRIHVILYTYSPCCRSTVEYAREVMEAKVMEDALTRIDAMSGENGLPPQEAVLPSRGSSVPVKTTPTSAPTSTVGHMTA